MAWYLVKYRDEFTFTGPITIHNSLLHSYINSTKLIFCHINPEKEAASHYET